MEDVVEDDSEHFEYNNNDFEKFKKSHYFEVEDISYWAKRNKNIGLSWQKETQFVMQLEMDTLGELVPWFLDDN